MNTIYGVEYYNMASTVCYLDKVGGLVLIINCIDNNTNFHNIIYTTLNQYKNAEIIIVQIYAMRDIIEFNDYIEVKIEEDIHYSIPIDFIKQCVDKNVLRCVLEEKRDRINRDINIYCPQYTKSARNI